MHSSLQNKKHYLSESRSENVSIPGPAIITITLSDVNDNAPSCNDQLYIATPLAENTVATTAVSLTPTVSCTDSDSGKYRLFFT